MARVAIIIDDMTNAKPDTKPTITFRRDHLARLRDARGLPSDAALAREAGMQPQMLCRVVNMADVSDVRLRTLARLAAAVSTPEQRVRIEDLIEQ